MKKGIIGMLVALSLMLTACDPGTREETKKTSKGEVTISTKEQEKSLADMTLEELKNDVLGTVGYADADNYGSKEIQKIDASINPDLGNINRYCFVHFAKESISIDVRIDFFEFDGSVVAPGKYSQGDQLTIKVADGESKVNTDDTLTITAVNGRFAIAIKDYAEGEAGEVPPTNVTGTFKTKAAQALYDRFVSLK